MGFRHNGLAIAAKFFASLALCVPAIAFAAVDCTDTGTTGVPQLECEALMDFYNATQNNGAWTNHTNWDTASAISTWFGVGVGGGHVQEINMDQNNVQGTFPATFTNLTELVTLDLSAVELDCNPPNCAIASSNGRYIGGNTTEATPVYHPENHLSGPLPSGFENLTHLTTLDLFDNYVSGSLPVNFGNLSGLTYLDLSYNLFSGAIPDSIGSLSGITELKFNDNQFSSIPTTIGNLTGLQKVYLQNNLLAGSIPSEIGQLTSVSFLELNNNQLTGSIPSTLNNLTNAFLIYLNRNQLTGAIPDLSGLTTIRIISLANNRLGYDTNTPSNLALGVLPDDFSSTWTHLQSIELMSNHLSGPLPSALLNHSTLVALRANSVGNDGAHTDTGGFSGSIPTTIGTATSLIDLRLNSNSLAGTIPQEILNLTSVDILWLDHNQLECLIPAGIETLAGLNNNNGPFKASNNLYDSITVNNNKLYATGNTLTWLNSKDVGWTNSQDNDADGDGAYDCAGVDDCPADPDKVAPGTCGCGVADTDTDGDGTPDCNDACPNDDSKLAAGVCGCGVADTDSDNDGTLDCNDACPDDPDKIAPGLCGCGNADVDVNNDSICDTAIHYTVSGHVYTKNGEPLSGVTVHSRKGAAVTNAEGYYIISNIAPDPSTSPTHASVTFYIRHWSDGYSISRRFKLAGVSGRSCTDDDSRDSDAGRTEKCKFDPLYIDQNLTNMDFKVNRCVNPSTSVKFYEDGNNRCIQEDTKPSQPSGVTATDATSTRGVDLSWSITDNASTYKIVRTTSDTAPTENSTVVGETISTTFTDRSAIPGVQYKYAIIGVNRTGTGQLSSPVTGSRQASGELGGEGDSATDSDGDGVSDEQEAHDQTDPMDRGSNLSALSSPAFTKYNTFLSQYNFLELVGSGTATVHATISLYDFTGTRIGSPLNVNVEPNAEVDVDIHSRVPADSYGLVKVEFNDGDTGVHLLGRMTVYRPDPDLEALPQAEQTYSFAFTRNLRNSIRGSTYATSNSYDPQGLGYLVPNWVEIINTDPSEHSFAVRIFRQDGSLASERTDISVPAYGEYDVQGGHEFGEGVFLIEIDPDDGNAHYFATVVRYSSNSTGPGEAQTYNFAMPIDARAGSGDIQYVPISNEVGSQHCTGGNLTGNPSWVQSNWLELINVLSDPVTVQVKFRSTGGEILGDTTVTLNSHAQEHLNAGALLPAGADGFAEINPDKEGSLLAQSNVYYHDNCGANQLDTAYSSAAGIAGTTDQIGSYNRFLDMQNFLTIINTSNENLNTNLQVMQGSQGKVGDARVSLLGHMCTTLDLSDETQFATSADTYGTMSLTTTASRKIIAENLRYREVNGVPDFAIATQVR